MGNININGKSAVHAKSEGILTTVDTCMTPPYCIPINYTNIAESKMTDMGASSVKIQGSPACNQKSNFKISKGDAPGCCGGTSSGSVGQMAEFINGSQDVTICGEPAVRNGDQMVSNLKNTPPQPLVQPPAGDAKAGTATAPEAMADFSQQFDFANVIGLAAGGKNVLERPNYEIWDKDGNLLTAGMLGKQGLTERVYTPEKEKLTVWLGDGGWKIFADVDHDSDTDTGKDAGQADAADDASINCVFKSFANQPIEGLDYQLVMNGKTTSAKTDAKGAAQALSDLKTGTQIDVLVLRERSKDYKKIGTLYAYAGETQYTIISPKIKFEAETAKHLG
ncbi:MAG: DUF4150 domain-containing protein [Gammaproteobacteria bacterium]|nr:DUF4150 domain-containing protein [Gammaproteobacteria bacterium]